MVVGEMKPKPDTVRLSRSLALMTAGTDAQCSVSPSWLSLLASVKLWPFPACLFWFHERTMLREPLLTRSNFPHVMS